MSKDRLEAFSDGVLAMIITIMVLELSVPKGATPDARVPLMPTLSSYVLSFVFLGIDWSNHRHVLRIVEHVNGRVPSAFVHPGLAGGLYVPVALMWLVPDRRVERVVMR